MNAMNYKGYVGVFEYEPDDEAFHGQVVGILDVVHFCGKSVDELKQALADSVEDYLEACASVGKQPEKPYSGRFVVRVSPDIHRLADQAAKASGKSLNMFVAEAVESMAARR